MIERRSDSKFLANGKRLLEIDPKLEDAPIDLITPREYENILRALPTKEEDSVCNPDASIDDWQFIYLYRSPISIPELD